MLDARAQARIGRPLLLLDLSVRVGEITPGGQRILLVSASLVGELPDVLVDLMGIVAAHYLGEVARWGLFEEAGQLRVNIRLHVV